MVRAAPGLSTAEVGASGSASNNSRKSVVTCDSTDESPSEGVPADGDESREESCSGSTASRPGKTRCWIQYAVPPTTIGTFFEPCASLI